MKNLEGGIIVSGLNTEELKSEQIIDTTKGEIGENFKESVLDFAYQKYAENHDIAYKFIRFVKNEMGCEESSKLSNEELENLSVSFEKNIKSY